MVALVHALAIASFALGVGLLIGGVLEGASEQELTLPLALVLGSVTARASTLLGLNGLAQAGGARVKSELRAKGLQAIDRLGPGRFHERSSVAVTTLLAQGIDALDAYFGRYLPQLLLAAIQTPVLLAVLWWTDVPTGLAITLVLPLIPVFMVLIGLVTSSIQKRQWQALTELGSAFLEIVEGLATLKIFGRHNRQVARIRAVTDDFRRKTMAVLRVSFLSSFVLELAASLSVAIVAVSIGIRLVNGDLPLWLGLFVLILVPDVFLPLRQVGAQFHQAAEGLAAAEDLFALYEQAEDIDARDSIPSRTLSANPENLRVESFQVTRDGHPVAKPVTADLDRGVLTVLTGPSGAGKSSFLLGLMGFADTAGKVLWAGEPVGGSDLRAHIAWAPQHPGLRQGSVADNIHFGGAVDRDALEQSLLWAAATDIPLSLTLGVHGAGLSGGQAQRVGLARAYYRMLTRESSLLLLDEPTSALDPERERQVLEGIRQILDRGVIVVAVSHRQSLMELPSREVRVTPEALEAAGRVT